MKPRIRLLPPELINQIAAGEVVERPASIVKELVENSIDAGANRIEIEVENGGMDFIKVKDNGCGIDSADAKLVFAQHATSKISSVNDLFAINSFGFRGEAIASIAGVAEVELHTKTDSADPISVEKSDGKVKAQPGAARQTGTTVIVKNLFARIPARRKFLKAPATEYRHIYNTVKVLALANHAISFILVHNDKQTLQLTAVPDTATRIKTLDKFEKDDLIFCRYDDPGIKIQAYLEHPRNSLSKSAKNQYCFVNKRNIKSPLIHKAVIQSFGESLMKNRQPNYYIFLDVDPQLVDVNIHPRKLEVKFSDERQIFSLIFRSLKSCLEDHLQQDFSAKLTVPVNNDLPNKNRDYPTTKTSAGKDKPQQVSIFSKSPKVFSKQHSVDLFRRPAIADNIPHERMVVKLESAYTENPKHQLFRTYILIETSDKLIFIDQHAAAERVNYEKLQSQLQKKHGLKQQRLLLPQEIELSKDDILLIRSRKDIINKLGYKPAKLTTNPVLETIPEQLPNKRAIESFRELLDKLDEEEYDTDQITDNVYQHLLATIACHSSIRAGDYLTQEQMNRLISDLSACRQPYSCPHGRPLLWELTRYELEKKFKRII